MIPILQSVTDNQGRQYTQDEKSAEYTEEIVYSGKQRNSQRSAWQGMHQDMSVALKTAVHLGRKSAKEATTNLRILEENLTFFFIFKKLN